MNAELMKKLSELSEEEIAYKNGSKMVDDTIYRIRKRRLIDSDLFLQQNKLVTARKHSRFVEFPEHGHNYIELMYVCGGKITHHIDGKEICMEEGDFLLLNQHIRHSLDCAQYEDIGINFIALPEFFDVPLQMLKKHNVIADFLVGVLKQEAVPQYLLFKLKGNLAIENLMENLIYSLLEEKAEETVINQYLMGLVFLYLLQNTDKLADGSGADYKEIVVMSALQYIESFYRNASLQKIADDFHLSLSAVSKLIKQKTGFTFQQMLIRKRFQKAVMMLMDTDLHIDDIALRVGYENLSYFHRYFKRIYGMTPAKYRFLHKEDDWIRLEG